MKGRLPDSLDKSDTNTATAPCYQIEGHSVTLIRWEMKYTTHFV
jgi:hypothetical protein